VITPAALNKLLEDTPFLIGRHYLIVQAFDFDAVSRFLRRQVERLDADSWSDLAQKIGRIGFWEFEDYRDSES
jgi:hypothetical protein